MPWRAIVTRPDGGVAIICPSPRCVRVLADGGGLAFSTVSQAVLGRLELHDWLRARLPHPELREIYATNFMPLELARAWEIEKLVRDPMWRPDRSDREAFAAQWIDALVHGGYSEREAVLLIAEFSMPAFATAVQLVDVNEIPTDRRYRDAWRRSSNGGPIWIDDDRAREIDEARLWEAYDGKAA